MFKERIMKGGVDQIPASHEKGRRFRRIEVLKFAVHISFQTFCVFFSLLHYISSFSSFCGRSLASTCITSFFFPFLIRVLPINHHVTHTNSSHYLAFPVHKSSIESTENTSSPPSQPPHKHPYPKPPTCHFSSNPH